MLFLVKSLVQEKQSLEAFESYTTLVSPYSVPLMFLLLFARCPSGRDHPVLSCPLSLNFLDAIRQQESPAAPKKEE